MRLDFLVAGLIVYAFLIWMPINGMQPQPRTVSRKLVHEKKQSLENTRKPTNQWVTIISQMPKEEESKK